MTRQISPSRQAGVGLRLPHLAEVAATRPDAGWFEIHPENFLANPHGAALLDDIARDYPIAVHTVGVSVGSAHGVDRSHLARVRALVDRIDPVLVSGHLAWSTHPGEYLNDLLPLPYDDESLDVVARHVLEVQDALGRPFLVENPSNYLGFGASTMTEAEFLCALVARTDCRLLCDVSNVYVSGHNLGYDPAAYLDALPAGAVAELHLGGFTRETDDAGGDVIVDTHDGPIDAGAWALYARAIHRFGPVPTLIEWDADLPPLDRLLYEARVAGEALRHAAC